MAQPDSLPEISVPGEFELFYGHNFSAVVGMLYGLTGSRSVAEDLAQEAFLRAHRDWAKVSHMDSPEGWVRRVSLNLARSRWRRLRSETAAVLRLSNTTRATEQPIDPDGELFWSEVRRLPKRQAQVVALRYAEDLPSAEIASILGISDGTVRALLHQARDRLRQRLTAMGVVDET